MPTFDYNGRDITGKLITGKRLAQSAENLSAQLLKEGITPVLITPAKVAVNYWAILKDALLNKKVPRDQLSMFARQMYVLSKTGVPITLSIKQLAENARSPRLADALRGVAEHLESGQDLAGAMQHYPHVFSPLMVSMIRVGQDSGRLDEAFLRLNQYLEMETTAIQRVKSASRYPMFVLIAIVAAVILVNIFVIPTFASVFETSKIPLPAYTVALINISAFFKQEWLLILILLVLFIGMIKYYLHTPQGKLTWSRYQLNLPVIGLLLRRIILLRFSQTFSITISSGISILDGLKLVAEALDNPYAQHEVMAMRDAVQRGNTLTRAAASSDLFTRLELQMLAVSEETGELGEMLSQIAQFYQREVDYDIKRLNDFMEPIIIMALAAMVLMLAFAVYMPMWNMVKLIHS